MLKRVGVHMTVERFPVGASLFEGESELVAANLAPIPDEEGGEDGEMEMFFDGRLRLTDEEYSVSYEESALTGMEGATSQLFFRLDQPDLVTMLRTGAVSTALVFEPNKRHTCVYKTPYMIFEACVHTLKVENKLLADATGGTLLLDYVVEIRGAQAERCCMTLSVHTQSGAGQA